MSNFYCEYCSALCEDSSAGYISGCEHYPPDINKIIMQIGKTYNWKNQSEQLIYIGKNWSGNGYWHQFERKDAPGKIWCEISDSDLQFIERSK